MKSAEVRLQGLSKLYHRTAAVDGVSLTIEPGSMVALLGPSGCGKTTCLRMIAGLVSPTSGDILLNGGRITHVPVHRSRFPSQLSGGQQQRVALARALVIEPAVLLLDEPLGALDKGLRESMQVELRALQRRLGVTTVMVTHDQDEALTMADRIVVMREGRLEQVGTATDIYQRPASRFVATFLGASNLFDGKVERGSGGEALVTTAAGLRLQVDGIASDAQDVLISVRPEAVIVNRLNGSSPPEDAPNTIVARVEQIIYRGFISHYYLKLHDGHEVIAYQQNQTRDSVAAYTQGEKVIVRWDKSSNHVIARD